MCVSRLFYCSFLIRKKWIHNLFMKSTARITTMCWVFLKGMRCWETEIDGGGHVFGARFETIMDRKLFTEPFRVLLVETRRWKTRAGSASFSLSDDSSITVTCWALFSASFPSAPTFVSFCFGDANDFFSSADDEPIDGIDSNDLSTISVP